ncbi:MAG: hypothetical protein WCF92_03100 [bacterium]
MKRIKIKILKFKKAVPILYFIILLVPTFSFGATLSPVSTTNNKDSFSGSTVLNINTGVTQNNNSNSFGIGTYSTQAGPLGTQTVGNNNPTVQSASQQGFSLVTRCLGGKSIGGGEYQCGWSDLVLLAKNLMVYLIFIGTTLAAISMAYAGFMYATSAGNSGKIEKAHQVFSTVAIGILFLWGGWLLIATIMKTLGVKDPYSLLNSSNVQGVTSTNH